MSDADNQMGGSGGDTGRRPGGPPPIPASEEARDRDPRGGEDPKEAAGRSDTVTEESEESFPASDPPANY